MAWLPSETNKFVYLLMCIDLYWFLSIFRFNCLNLIVLMHTLSILKKLLKLFFQWNSPPEGSKCWKLSAKIRVNFFSNLKTVLLKVHFLLILAWINFKTFIRKNNAFINHRRIPSKKQVLPKRYSESQTENLSNRPAQGQSWQTVHPHAEPNQ